MLLGFIRPLPDLFALLCAMVAHRWLWRMAAGTHWERYVRPALVCSSVFVAAVLLLEIPDFRDILPNSPLVYWVRGGVICWAICLAGLCGSLFVTRRLDRAIPPDRREFLRLAKTAVMAAPVAVTGYGVFLERRNIQLREVEIKIPGLAKDLDGLKIGQITDLHCSPFLSPADVANVVNRMNDLRPHLTVVTGDLITREGDPLDECIAELAKLRADAGVYGCLGNHEIYAECEDYVTWQAARKGMKFLRGQRESLSFGSAKINLAGVDYQKMHGPYLRGARNLMASDGSLNLLLSHNPDAYTVAKDQGWDLMLAGHTHGGQVTVEYLQQHVNLARFYTKYVSGLYQEAGKSLYVSRGLGTVGAPMRLSAPPELTLLKLRG